ncbi:MAG: septum formation initiator family protein [Smithellaceae bacterium]|nr:septum formation initiator family protein [Smithellaceae bacterium]
MKFGRILIIFILLGSLVIVFGNRGLIDNYHMLKRHEDLKRANAEIFRENRETERIISLLKDDLAYIEMTARRELGMTRKGELVYRFTH